MKNTHIAINSGTANLQFSRNLSLEGTRIIRGQEWRPGQLRAKSIKLAIEFPDGSGMFQTMLRRNYAVAA